MRRVLVRDGTIIAYFLGSYAVLRAEWDRHHGVSRAALLERELARRDAEQLAARLRGLVFTDDCKW